MEEFSKWVWNEKFWLPQGYSWEDLESTATVNKPRFSDLYYVPILAILLVVIRFLFERYIAKPFCYWLGIPANTKTVLEENVVCERVFNTITKHPHNSQVNGLAKQLGWSATHVLRWFHRRRKSCEISLITKATESCWRCCIYFCLFSLGSFAILPTDWFYDTHEWMRGYIRNQDFNIYLKSYYLLELAFYTSLLFSQFIDVKRKDFYQMFAHHIITVLLIFSSYAIGHHRIGVVIMWLHDASDYWLEAAKVLNYAKKQKLCDGVFAFFSLIFVGTRWIYFPFWVLHAMLILTWEVTGPFPSYYYFSTLLVTLQVLHIYWGALIIQVVYRFAVLGKIDKDIRSDTESSDGESEVSEMKNNIVNKKKK